jgi:hypothetical protein
VREAVIVHLMDPGMLMVIELYDRLLERPVMRLIEDYLGKRL